MSLQTLLLAAHLLLVLACLLLLADAPELAGGCMVQCKESSSFETCLAGKCVKVEGLLAVGFAQCHDNNDDVRTCISIIFVIYKSR